MASFFVPGSSDAVRAEEAYSTIRALAASATGETPTAHRIESISCRLSGADVVAEVGRKSPAGKSLVTAILDLGRRRPYLIHCGAPDDASGQILVNKPVYDVTEFDR